LTCVCCEEINERKLKNQLNVTAKKIFNAYGVDKRGASITKRDVSLSTSVSEILRRINDLEYRRKPTLAGDRVLLEELNNIPSMSSKKAITEKVVQQSNRVSEEEILKTTKLNEDDEREKSKLKKEERQEKINFSEEKKQDINKFSVSKKQERSDSTEDEKQKMSKVNKAEKQEKTKLSEEKTQDETKLSEADKEERSELTEEEKQKRSKLSEAEKQEKTKFSEEKKQDINKLSEAEKQERSELTEEEKQQMSKVNKAEKQEKTKLSEEKTQDETKLSEAEKQERSELTEKEMQKRTTFSEEEERERTKSSVEKRNISANVELKKDDEKTTSKPRHNAKSKDMKIRQKTWKVSRLKPGERRRNTMKVKHGKKIRPRMHDSFGNKVTKGSGKKSHQRLKIKSSRKPANRKNTMLGKNARKPLHPKGGKIRHSNVHKGHRKKFPLKSKVKAANKRVHAGKKMEKQNMNKKLIRTPKVSGKKSINGKTAIQTTYRNNHKKFGVVDVEKTVKKTRLRLDKQRIASRGTLTIRENTRHKLTASRNEIVKLNEIIRKLDFARQLCQQMRSSRSPGTGRTTPGTVKTTVKRVSRLVTSSKRTIRTVMSTLRSKQQSEVVRNRVRLILLHTSGILEALRHAKHSIVLATGIDKYRRLKHAITDSQRLVKAIKVLTISGRDKIRKTSGPLGTLFVVTETDRVLMSMKVRSFSNNDSARNFDSKGGEEKSLRRLELIRDSSGSLAVFNKETLAKIQDTFDIKPQLADQVRLHITY